MFLKERLKKNFLFVIFPLICSNSYSQIEEDVVSFHDNTLHGSARSQALGGAFGALGGDPASIYTNPAGLGFYRKSEISIGFNTQFHASKNEVFNLNDVSNTDFTNQLFNLNHLAIIFEAPNINTESEHYGGAWGLSYQRTKNFHQTFGYEGRNDANSIRNFFLNDLHTGDSTTLGELYDGIPYYLDNRTYTAWASFLVQQVGDEDENKLYETFADGDPVTQNSLTERKGNLGEWSLSYGGNYNDQLYYGFSASLISANYEQNNFYTETLATQDSLISFDMNDVYTSKGSGVNFKGGIIFSPIPELKLGFNFKSPSWIWLTESQTTTVYSSFNNITIDGELLNDEGPVETSTGSFNYRVKTPATFGFAATYFVQKHGFITLDLAYVDYSSARLDSRDDDFSLVNRNIQSMFRPIWNIKLGAEARYKNLRFRLGFAKFGDPYQEDEAYYNIDRSRKYYTAGIGYKTGQKSFDLSISRSSYRSIHQDYYLYNQATPYAETKNVDVNILFGASFYY